MKLNFPAYLDAYGMSAFDGLPVIEPLIRQRYFENESELNTAVTVAANEFQKRYVAIVVIAPRTDEMVILPSG